MNYEHTVLTTIDVYENIDLVLNKKIIKRILSTKKFFLISTLFFLIIILIVNFLIKQGQPEFEYIVVELKGSPQQQLNVTRENNSVLIDETTYWDGEYKPSLKTKGNNLNIYFSQIAINQRGLPFNLKAKISNLKPGDYKIQLFYPKYECQYEGDDKWEKCSMLIPKREVNRRTVYIKTGESEIEIKQYQ
ncbi:MAG: hypothetical protein Q7K55_06335 [Candidatus Levybacteria bacterium]|nr:hypothetical protein [Candidatus Levybacteria bacterium]